MREILFRGKRLDNGEWAESGSLLRTKNEETGEIIIFLGSAQPAVYIFNKEKDVVSVTSLGECAYYRVDPDTIGQYTGLCDKNGKKIFEGDICQVGHLLYKVEFNYSQWKFSILSNKVYCYPAFHSHCGERCIIIGNIHDNPELLEGEG